MTTNTAFDSVHAEIMRLVRASEILLAFETKHQVFLGRCARTVSVSGDGKEPSIAFYKDSAGDVAQYFGNDGWGYDNYNRRTRWIDGVLVSVWGLQTLEGMKELPTAPLFPKQSAHHLDVVGGEECGKANVQTIQGSHHHGIN